MECSGTVLPVIGKDNFIENKANSLSPILSLKNESILTLTIKNI